jgi:ABC-2 type transport system permease protein
VGVWTPADVPSQDVFGQPQASLKRYNTIGEQLRQEYNVQPLDLTSGQALNNIDVMLVVAPQAMTDTERFAVDQYLMRGGSVIVAAGNYAINPDLGGSLGVAPIEGGLREMLAHYGLSVGQSLVLDPQNEPFPVQVNRNLGGFQVREIQAINYPFFVDVRPDGMDKQSPVLANIPALTVNWASPITVDETKNAGRQVTTLLKSSPASWLRTDTNIQPDLETYPDLGFPVEGEQKSHILAVAVQGVFESYFKGQAAPAPVVAQPGLEQPGQNPVGVIESSPDTARLIVVGSAEFLNDIVFELSSSLTRDRYLNSLQFVQNTVDWSVEDLDLLTIRSRGTSVRVLTPLNEAGQLRWEIANYVLALLAVIAIGVIWQFRKRNEQPMELLPQSSKPSSGGDEQPVVRAA